MVVYTPSRLLAVALCLMLSSLARAQMVNTPTTANPFRVYFMGNSMTDQVSYAGLDEMATGRGQDHAWGRQIILGSPISWIWEHPNDGYTENPYLRYQNALTNYQWDALTLSPTDRHLYDSNGGDVPMTLNFLDYARTTSPDIQLYIYQRTPRRAEPSPGVYTPIDYPAQWLRNYVPSGGGSLATTYTRDYYAKLMAELHALQPAESKPIQMIPLGDVVYELDFRIKHGQIPGMTDINEIYMDASHYTNIGRYLTGLTFFATLYDQSPLGLPVPSQYGAISPELAWAMQNVVADVVEQRAPGVPEPSGLLAVLAMAGLAAGRRFR
jgi:hypothetical protein